MASSSVSPPAQVPLPPSPSPASTLQNINSVAHRPRVDAVKALLNQSLRISTSDGRIFIGTFVCVDKHKNIILANTDEYRIGGSPQGRYVTMVVLPWRLVEKVEAPTDSEDTFT